MYPRMISHPCTDVRSLRKWEYDKLCSCVVMCAYDGFGFGERTVFDRDAVFDVGLACGGMEMAAALLPETFTTERPEINETSSFAIASSYSVCS